MSQLLDIRLAACTLFRMEACSVENMKQHEALHTSQGSVELDMNLYSLTREIADFLQL